MSTEETDRRSRGRRLAPVQKTYWHLLSAKKIPSEYEIVSSNLNYHVTAGFEVKFPTLEWYAKYLKGSPVQFNSWESFVDPRRTTYASYTALQAGKELQVDGILQSMEESHYDRKLSSEWLDLLQVLLPPLLYPIHAFQMTAGYVGHMLSGSRVVLAHLFQAADEMRRIQRLAYRIRGLQAVRPGFGENRKGKI